jgi:ATP-dependent DNA ligase
VDGPQVSDLPADLRARPVLALTKASETIPPPSALPGGAQYEPKWDGFRLAIVRNRDATTAWSRHGKDLTVLFPDLVHAATRQVPPGFVLDGEAVIWVDGAVSFTALQARTTTRGPALRSLARARPASYVCFDVLAVAGHDTRPLPLNERRRLLEHLAGDWDPPLTLAPATTDPGQGRAWFTELTAAGLEGLVVKGLAGPYPAGRREWVKVKHRTTTEVVCAAVIGTLARPRALVAGLPEASGRLRIAGRTGQLPARVSAQVGAALRPHDPATGEHPWPPVVPPSWFDRYTPEKTPVSLTRITPVVIEVAADTARTSFTFRHQLRFLRLRPDLDPAHLTPGRS